tara:strand:+ start:3292 stop:3477 length:186 start_codon:yes stop_codon:yes gene_type:complete
METSKIYTRNIACDYCNWWVVWYDLTPGGGCDFCYKIFQTPEEPETGERIVLEKGQLGKRV